MNTGLENMKIMQRATDHDLHIANNQEMMALLRREVPTHNEPRSYITEFGVLTSDGKSSVVMTVLRGVDANMQVSDHYFIRREDGQYFRVPNEVVDKLIQYFPPTAYRNSYMTPIRGSVDRHSRQTYL